MLNERVIGTSKKDIERLKKTLKKGEPLTIPARSGQKPPKGYTLVNTGKWKWKPSFIRDDAMRMVARSMREGLRMSMKDLIESKTLELTERLAGHHAMIDGKYYADSNFLNAIRGTMPGFELVHMGGGEFALKGPDKARIDFDRMRGQDFEGKVGRSHQVYDNKGGKLVKQLIKAMEKAKLSTLSEDAEQIDERMGRGMPASGGMEREALKMRLKKSMDDEKKKKSGKGKMPMSHEGVDDDDDDAVDEGMTVSRGVEKAAMLSRLKGKSGKKMKKKSAKDDDQMESDSPEQDVLAAELSALLGEDYVSEQLPFLLE